MSGKVAPSSPVSTHVKGGVGGKKTGRRSRVFIAISDAYEFDGWARLWLACGWFVVSTTTVSYSYPPTAGTFHSSIKSIMTSYDTSDGSTADVRSQSTFDGGLTHALQFLTTYANRADAAGYPEGTLPITEYDKIMFARLEVDLDTNCKKQYKPYDLPCYRTGIHPATGAKLEADALHALAGPAGRREVELLDVNVTRSELRARVQQILDQELLFLSTYSFHASLIIGVSNTAAGDYPTVYFFTVTRKSTDSIGSQAMRSVVTLIDCLDVRKTPVYTVKDDFSRAASEIISLLFLFKAILDEVTQFHICRAWCNLFLNDKDCVVKGSGWRRTLHLVCFYGAQPWNILDVTTIVNCIAWWIMYVVLLIKSYNMEVDNARSLAEFDAVRSYASLRQQHLVWGVFTALLVGLRVLPHFKAHPGLTIYSHTLKLTWQRLRDLLLFFGYVYFLMVVLIQPLFELTGANPLFRDTGTGILNVALMTFQYMGFNEFFANNAPTFGTYWVIFMFFFWVVVLILVVISQNVLLALVAGAYEESKEVVGAVEFTMLQLSIYRLMWIVYSRWHRWILRKSRYTLAEQLLAHTSRVDVGFFSHVFARWALADLPEMKTLAQLYTDPASDILYVYSPWAWQRSSPWDSEQQAPWDEQLHYPMYSWEDVPLSGSSERPYLRRMPPLFSRDTPAGTSPARSRLPVAYIEGAELFSMSEEEVDQLLDVAEWCWGRMIRYPMVQRWAGLGWSERGRQLVREGLLEIYRRHMLAESTGTTVSDVGGGGGWPGATRLGKEEPAGLQASVRVGIDGAARGDDAGDDRGDGSTAVDAAANLRTRQFSLFNRRGRIADNLDLLWGEISEVRQQQSEIKNLLEQLLKHKEQHSMVQGIDNTDGLVSRVDGGGAMRGPAALTSDGPVVVEAAPPSGASNASRGRGPWQ